MLNNLEIINPITYPNWDELITSTQNYSFFHTAAWAKVLSESYGYTPIYFTQIENDHLRVAIPMMEVRSFITGKRGVSLPFTDYCEPIIADDINFQDVFDNLIEYGKQAGWKYLITKGWKQFPKDSIHSSYCYGHTLSLKKNEDEVFSKFRNSTKRNIKKAIKEGFEVKVDNSLESIKEFYKLNCLTRRIHGLPPQPYFFFEKVHRHIISEDRGFIVLALLNAKSIAAAVYFQIGQKAYYKYGASDRKYQHLRANNLIMWKAIKYYCRNGYRHLCFGKTEMYNKGLLQFKAGWGTNEQIIKYHKYDLNKKAFVKGATRVKGFHNKIFSNMPLALLRLVGSILYRHFG